MRLHLVALSFLVVGCRGPEKSVELQTVSASASAPAAPSASASAGVETIESVIMRGQVSSANTPPPRDSKGPVKATRSCSVVAVFRSGAALVAGKAAAEVAPDAPCDFGPLESKARASASPLRAGLEKNMIDVTAGIAFSAPAKSSPEGYTIDVKTDKRTYTAHDLFTPTYVDFAEPPGKTEGTYRKPDSPAPSRNEGEATHRLCSVLLSA